MRRFMIALAAAAALGGITPAPGHAQSLEPAASRKLHELGYPADPAVAVQRWRADNGRGGTGALTSAEATALAAQPMPEFLAAMVGNPFTGLGVAMKHKTRADAEREAIRLCKAQGGGTACVRPMVARAEQCVAVVGYEVTVDRRPVYRTSVAISNDVSRSLDAAREACPNGASHPELCRPLLTFCGDGRSFQIFEDTPASDKTAEVAGPR